MFNAGLTPPNTPPVGLKGVAELLKAGSAVGAAAEGAAVGRGRVAEAAGGWSDAMPGKVRLGLLFF